MNTEHRTSNKPFIHRATLFLILAALAAGGGPALAGESSNAGSFVSRGQLAIVGYTTPENAFETMMWAMINGKFENYLASFTPELQNNLQTTDKQKFSSKAKHDRPLFKGYQIVAEKQINDHQVDLKFHMDDVEGPRTFGLANGQSSTFGLQLMVKVDNEWKAGSEFRGYETNWDDTNVVTFANP